VRKGKGERKKKKKKASHLCAFYPSFHDFLKHKRMLVLFPEAHHSESAFVSHLPIIFA